MQGEIRAHEPRRHLSRPRAPGRLNLQSPGPADRESASYQIRCVQMDASLETAGAGRGVPEARIRAGSRGAEDCRDLVQSCMPLPRGVLPTPSLRLALSIVTFPPETTSRSPSMLGAVARWAGRGA